MSDEIEAAGAVATAGLVAKAIERPRNADSPGVRHGDGRCLNCGADVSGNYCASCGQPTHVHRTLGHVLEEFLHGIVHFDAKAWRTLPMLVGRPGTLTYNYIHGKRARYISPLATFLFTVFLMFFVFAVVGPRDVLDMRGSDLSRLSEAELEQSITEAEQGAAEMRAAANRVRDQGAPGALGFERGAAAFEASQAKLAEEKERRAAIKAGAAPASAAAAAEEDEETATLIRVPGLNTDALNAKFREKLKNPDLLFYKVQQNAYKFSFLLVPISLPFVALLFLWKRGWTLYDHVVFTLYSLSFMSLLFITAALLGMAGEWAEGWIALIVGAGVPAHMFFQLGGAYGLKWWSALWRTFFLLIFAGISLLIFVVLMIVFGVLA